MIYQSPHPSCIHLYIRTAPPEAPSEAHTTLNQAKSPSALDSIWREDWPPPLPLCFHSLPSLFSSLPSFVAQEAALAAYIPRFSSNQMPVGGTRKTIEGQEENELGYFPKWLIEGLSICQWLLGPVIAFFPQAPHHQDGNSSPLCKVSRCITISCWFT